VESSRKSKFTRADVILLFLDIGAALAFGGALALHALERSPFHIESVFAHVLLAFGFVAAVTAHNLLGRRPLYWSHFDFLVAVFFGYLIINSCYYSEALAISTPSVLWGLDGLWAFALGRYLFFRRLRLFNLVVLATCFALWALCEFLLRPGGGTASATPLFLRLEYSQKFAFVIGVVLLLAQPFFLLRKPADFVFGLWGAVILAGITFWGVQTTLDLLEAVRRGTFGAMFWPQGLLLQTIRRIILAYPVTGTGLGTFGLMVEAYRPVAYGATSPFVSGLLRMGAELGAVGMLLFFAAWLRVPWFVVRHWGLFPNRRLRMGVLIFLSLVLLVVGRLFVADDFLPQWQWTLLWGIFGTFVSLVVVRDPLRIFYEPVALSSVEQSPRSRSAWVKSTVRSVLRPGASDPSAFRPGGTVWLRLAVATVFAVGILFLQSIPYLAHSLAERRGDEALSSLEYGVRLERAVRMFPVFSDGWAKLAQHYQERASGDSFVLLNLAPTIEGAYTNAIRWNPYEPSYYEQLAFFYSDTNASSKALETLRKGVSNNPNHFVLRMLLVREYERAQSYALATWHLRQALFRISPQQAELFIRLAELYELRGMRMDAVRSCQYARQGLPDSSNALMRLRRVAERLRIAYAMN